MWVVYSIVDTVVDKQAVNLGNLDWDRAISHFHSERIPV